MAWCSAAWGWFWQWHWQPCIARQYVQYVNLHVSSPCADLAPTPLPCCSDSARSVLVAMVKQLGADYLPFVCEVLMSGERDSEACMQHGMLGICLPWV